jgi:hypothetical protein
MRELLLILKRHRHSTALIAKWTSKNVSIPLTARSPNRKPANEKLQIKMTSIKRITTTLNDKNKFKN